MDKTSLWYRLLPVLAMSGILIAAWVAFRAMPVQQPKPIPRGDRLVAAAPTVAPELILSTVVSQASTVRATIGTVRDELVGGIDTVRSDIVGLRQMIAALPQPAAVSTAPTEPPPASPAATVETQPAPPPEPRPVIQRPRPKPSKMLAAPAAAPVPAPAPAPVPAAAETAPWQPRYPRPEPVAEPNWRDAVARR